MEPLLAERTHHLGEGAIDWTLFRDDCLSKAVVLLAGVTSSDRPDERDGRDYGSGTDGEKQSVSAHAER